MQKTIGLVDKFLHTRSNFRVVHVENIYISPHFSCGEIWNISTWQIFLHIFTLWYLWQISGMYFPNIMFSRAYERKCDILPLTGDYLFTVLNHKLINPSLTLAGKSMSIYKDRKVAILSTCIQVPNASKRHFFNFVQNTNLVLPKIT